MRYFTRKLELVQISREQLQHHPKPKTCSHETNYGEPSGRHYIHTALTDQYPHGGDIKGEVGTQAKESENYYTQLK